MKKLLLSNVIVALLVLAIALPWHARAQVATTTITTGINATLKADAGQFLAIPQCSLSAKCTAQLEICNMKPVQPFNTVPDSAHCIFIAASGQTPFSSVLWIGVSQTTSSSTGAISTTPYVFGTLQMSVPNSEVNIIP